MTTANRPQCFGGNDSSRQCFFATDQLSIMGYLCPVCETPFGDDQSLADHLAVTAILHGGDHERWLTETIDGWKDVDRATVADRVVDHAEAVAADHPSDSEHASGSSPLADSPRAVGQQSPEAEIPDAAGMRADGNSLDAEAQSILQQAHAFTQAMHSDREADNAESAETDNQ